MNMEFPCPKCDEKGFDVPMEKQDVCLGDKVIGYVLVCPKCGHEIEIELAQEREDEWVEAQMEKRREKKYENKF